MRSSFFYERFELGTSSTESGRMALRKFTVRWLPATAPVAAAVAYYVGSRIGFALTPHTTPIALFWPPNAMLLAALLLVPVRTWWIYWLVVLPAHLLVQMQMGVPLATSLGWYISNTSEALIGAGAICYLSRFRKTGFGFNDTKELKVFLLGAVLAAPFLTSFMDAATAARTGYASGYWVLWGTRLVSNMIANLTLVPIIVTLFREGPSWFRKITLARCLELVCLLLGVTLVSIYVFIVPEGALANFSAAMFAPLPFLLWAALRFGPGGLSFSLLVVALLSLGNAIRGLQTSEAALVARNVLTLQVMLAAFGVPLLWLSALVRERRYMKLSVANRRDFLMQTEHALRGVGRKLHTDLTQQLTLLCLQVEDLSGKIGSSTWLQSHLFNLNEEIIQLSAETREWSHVLDPVSIEYLGLAGALTGLFRRAGENSRVKFSFSTEVGNENPDSVTSLCLYRVAQEAVENIVKLNSAHTAKATLEIDEESARLVIEHDGTGMSSEGWQETAIGVVGASQRVALLDGTFSVDSSGAGARIDVAVPLRKAG